MGSIRLCAFLYSLLLSIPSAYCQPDIVDIKDTNKKENKTNAIDSLMFNLEEVENNSNEVLGLTFKLSREVEELTLRIKDQDEKIKMNFYLVLSLTFLFLLVFILLILRILGMSRKIDSLGSLVSQIQTFDNNKENSFIRDNNKDKTIADEFPPSIMQMETSQNEEKKDQIINDWFKYAFVIFQRAGKLESEIMNRCLEIKKFDSADNLIKISSFYSTKYFDSQLSISKIDWWKSKLQELRSGELRDEVLIDYVANIQDPQSKSDILAKKVLKEFLIPYFQNLLIFFSELGRIDLFYDLKKLPKEHENLVESLQIFSLEAKNNLIDDLYEKLELRFKKIELGMPFVEISHSSEVADNSEKEPKFMKPISNENNRQVVCSIYEIGYKWQQIERKNLVSIR